MKKNLVHKLKAIALPMLTVSIALGIIVPSAAKTADSVATQLQTAIDGSWRTAENRARDPYRHPLQTLSFFAIKPNATVIELFPSGKAYYSEILAPFLKDQGQYIAVNVSDDPEDAGQKEKFSADPLHYGKIKVLTITPPVIEFGAENSADFFLTFRNVHNFAMKGAEADLFKAIYKVLKPGGVLGIVDHRAKPDKTLDEVKNSGYIPEALVIAAAEKAGFKLVAHSDVNNNSKDTKDHVHGVWSLPPTLYGGDKDREKYLAIGESDRFTLRFIKP
ncbi:MAG TPA: methyltransferase [Cellvibrio sp.]|nr:methyltransferase [Cellvibrio sp.]